MHSDVTIEIEAAVIEFIGRTIRAGDHRCETGGALFGPSDGSRVLHAAGPGPKALHGARSFRRDLAHTQQIAEQLYRSDGSHWIGEWHTHVDVPAVPSEVDLETYVRHVTDPDLQFARFVALIVSLSGTVPTLATWSVEHRGAHIILVSGGVQPIVL
ncbi:Mov34/MPN/PAD-1 family protein [Microbacterium maritypicum]|jgi:integrative and conjugative element protein (TIGR02256 family)|uniref:Mov34/MPN/PAD-1 family protein n=1 Tax=Microbacterium maritypicum TaxID=33918 RepID=UPI003F4F7BCE